MDGVDPRRLSLCWWLWICVVFSVSVFPFFFLVL